VKSVQNFGAGDVIELERTDGSTEFLPFTKAVVPEVDVEGGKVVVDPPVGVLVGGEMKEAKD
jgi:16S rRNA processing protein RimM